MKTDTKGAKRKTHPSWKRFLSLLLVRQDCLCLWMEDTLQQ